MTYRDLKQKKVICLFFVGYIGLRLRKEAVINDEFNFCFVEASINIYFLFLIHLVPWIAINVILISSSFLKAHKFSIQKIEWH